MTRRRAPSDLTRYRSHRVQTRIITFALALVGVGAFHLANLPLPWLLGPLFACLIASLAGMRLEGIKVLNDPMRTILGVAIGAAITPALLDRLGAMAGSVALVPVFLICIGAFGYPYFRRFWGFDKATAYYAAMPGGLQDMLLFGEAAGGDARALGLIHATRVLLIVMTLPLVLQFGLGIPLDRPPGEPASSVPLLELVMMAAIGLVGWQLAKWVGLFGASILGPLILTAVFSLSDFLHHRPPAEAIYLAQFFIGLIVGVKYVGVTAAEVRRAVAAAIGYTAALFVLSALFTGFVVWMNFAPLVPAMLAFSPGGQAEMAVLALVAGADVAFIITHHLARITLVIIGAPLVRKLL